MRRQKVISRGSLLLLCLLAYANSLGNGFVFDDISIIVENSLVTDRGSILKIFSTPYWLQPGAGLFRPVTLFSFHLNHALDGLNPFGFHLTNVVLHMIVVTLLYGLGIRLGLSPYGSYLSAALFAVHPIHTEAVSNIVGRAELLMSLGVLLSLVWYIDSRAASPLRPGFLVASLAAFSISLLSKEQAMVLPFLIVLYDVSFRSDRELVVPAATKRVAMRYAGYFVLLGILILVRLHLMGPGLFMGPSDVSFMDNPLAHSGWVQRLPGALFVANKYLILFAWPSSLCADYSYNALPLPSRLWEPAPLATAIVMCILIVVAFWSFIKGKRLAFFAFCFFLLTFAPVSNIIRPIGTIMGERLLYLPSAGLSLLIGVGLDTLMARHELTIRSRTGKVVAIAVACVLIAAITRTSYRNRDWRDCKSIVRSSLRTSPRNARVHVGVAGIHFKDRDFESAVAAFEKAVRIYPDLPLSHAAFAQNYGTALLGIGNEEKAITYLVAAVQLDPSLVNARYHLGIAYARIKDFPRAAEQFSRVLDLSSAYNDHTYDERAAYWLQRITVDPGL